MVIDCNWYVSLDIAWMLALSFLFFMEDRLYYTLTIPLPLPFPCVYTRLLLLSFAFTISSFFSAASWRPHPVLDVVLRCHRRSKSTGTHSQYASWFVVHRSRRVARRCNPTHSCCCGMVPRLFGLRNQFSTLHWPCHHKCVDWSLLCGNKDPVGSWLICVLFTWWQHCWYCYQVCKMNCL